MLSDFEIHEAIDRGHLGLDPYVNDLVQPNSIDVRLDQHFLLPSPVVARMDTAAVPRQHMKPVTAQEFDMQPGQFVLGSTIEAVRMPRDLVGQVEGKSSIGRLGLLVHVTAGVIDSGFEGQITLELVNLAPWTVVLHAGMTIAQLAFRRCEPVALPYRSRYQGQRGPVESRYTGAARTTRVGRR